MSISRDRLRPPALVLATVAMSGALLAAPAQATTVPAPRSAVPVVPASTGATTSQALVQQRITGVLATAASLKGRPYRYGATGPRAFDCSGYTKYVFARNGITLPRTAAQQYRAVRKVAKSQARPGDLVFIGGARTSHVGIYAGKGMMWHSPRSGKTVRLIKIWTPRWTAGRAIG